MTAIQIACRLCTAQPYEMCVNVDGSNAPFIHGQRIEDAAEMSSSAGEDPELVKQAIDAAVDDLI